MMNLKQVLMVLGNRLVTERHHIPSQDREKIKQLAQVADMNKSLGVLVLFTEWLNENEDAREILDELGVQWPIITMQVG